MDTPQYALSDWIGVSIAFELFSLLTMLPGYALGWLLGVFQFRQRTLPFRLALSVPLAISIVPLLSFLLGLWLSLDVCWIFYGVLCVLALLLLSREKKMRAQLRPNGVGPVLCLMFVWIAIAGLMLTDIQFGKRVYFPIIGFDYAVRSAFTASISTWGLPAQTPFFFSGHAIPLRYHYYWLILCGMVERLGSPAVSARQALIAGTLWCGLGLICLVALYLRLFSSGGATRLTRRTTVAISLMGVTGLDILPALLMLFLHRVGIVNGISPSVEWWNEQVDGWLYTMLWEPHYVASLIACMTGFLLLWSTSETGMRKPISGLVAGLAFATAVGSGIYVALVFAVFLAVWVMITLAKRWFHETANLAIAGAVAIAASSPYLRSLRSPEPGTALAQLTIRKFDLAQILLLLIGRDRPWQQILANIVFLPLNYALELGFFAAVGLIVWLHFRRPKRRATRSELAGFSMAATSVIICTFFRSSVISNNDLGWRGFLIAQFVLLIWAADLLSMPSAIARSDKRMLIVLLVLGAAGVAYDLAIVRFYPVLSDAQWVPKLFWLAQDEKLGSRTYAHREAYAWLQMHTSPQTVIQQNPDVAYQDTFYGLYADRRTAAEDLTCGAAFAEATRGCAPIVERLKELYSIPGQTSLENICQSLPVDMMIAKDTDRAWRDKDSWVWSHEPAFANDFVRLYACSKVR